MVDRSRPFYRAPCRSCTRRGASLCSRPRPQAGEAGRMPALTRNRRFARSTISSERAGTPAGAGSTQTVEACGAEPGRSCPISPLAQLRRGRCVGRARAGRVARPFAKGTPAWDPTSGRVVDCAHSSSSRSSSIALGRRCRTGVAGAATAAPTCTRAAARRAVARQPDQDQRRLPQELRCARPDRHRVRGDRHARGRRRQAGVEPGDRVPQDARSARRSSSAARTRPARSPSTSWRRSPTPRIRVTSAARPPQNNLVARLLATAAHDRRRQGTVRRAGPDLRRRVPPGPRARRARRGRTCRRPIARVTAGIAWLTKQQCANGLWQAYRANTTTAVPGRRPERRSPVPTRTAPRWPCRDSRRGASRPAAGARC